MSTAPRLSIRRLEREDLGRAMPLVVQLRPHLDEAALLRLYDEQQRIGYELYAACLGDEMVGLAGMRPVTTLARGPHLHLDDLVIADGRRSSGLGAQLLRFAEDEARRRGLGKLFLDARQQAIPFYERNGYAFHQSPLMRKDV